MLEVTLDLLDFDRSEDRDVELHLPHVNAQVYEIIVDGQSGETKCQCQGPFPGLSSIGPMLIWDSCVLSTTEGWRADTQGSNHRGARRVGEMLAIVFCKTAVV